MIGIERLPSRVAFEALREVVDAGFGRDSFEIVFDPTTRTTLVVFGPDIKSSWVALETERMRKTR